MDAKLLQELKKKKQSDNIGGEKEENLSKVI